MFTDENVGSPAGFLTKKASTAEREASSTDVGMTGKIFLSHPLALGRATLS